jgi:hypothetical protein
MDFVVLFLLSSPFWIAAFVVFYTRRQTQMRKQKLSPFIIDLGLAEQQIKFRKGLLHCDGFIEGMPIRLYEKKVAQRKVWTCFDVYTTKSMAPLVISDTSRRVEIYSSFDRNLSEVENHVWVDKVRIFNDDRHSEWLSDIMQEVIDNFAAKPKGYIEISGSGITYCFPRKLWDESDFSSFRDSIGLVLQLASN